MKTIPTPPTLPGTPAQAPRMDLYAFIHKALRSLMSDTLLRLGRADADDRASADGALAQVRELLAACEAHITKEEHYVHPLVERAVGGASSRVAGEHQDHADSIGGLRALCDGVEQVTGPVRAGALHRLYLELSRFVGENFEHMQVEESRHNAVLWAHYSDAELKAVHDEILAGIQPAEMMFIMRWMLPALSPTERLGMLAGMQAEAPPPAFAAVLDLAREVLDAAQWAGVQRGLGLTAATDPSIQPATQPALLAA
ncbi:MAG: hemerythrin domain-containing protein [Aquabacterium sp.]|nr:hemerythrin domain-containing protein [Aquabacterium sp.]